ncbi:PhzF family phenazine biosynthesis protein [Pedobacter sp. L105]|uniref:PhzF family phenazine biosynthesis protein n=1 Tax=Pedobacter sp. L105 TaxID=1641871 RepID=UPI00131B172F|nr:PhzF family phenazine biosynthesis protein [Pedobacter sp. L105]
MKKIPYYHVDVFTDVPLSGNGLTVFTEADGLSNAIMLKLTQEMRQFESIFLQKVSENSVRANIFTCEEELDFAGHPILGAAATLHDLQSKGLEQSEWLFILNKKTVAVTVVKRDYFYHVSMNQGPAEFGETLNEEETAWLLDSISLTEGDLYPGLKPVVVSTGLPYLIIPLQKNGFGAKIRINDLSEKISAFGAKFIGILEIPSRRIRSGDNLGQVEDIATGSLAGPAGAYLVKYGFQKANTLIQINQGENLGRPSQLFVEVKEKDGKPGDIQVSGHVVKVSQSLLDSAIFSYLAETSTEQ